MKKLLMIMLAAVMFTATACGKKTEKTTPVTENEKVQENDKQDDSEVQDTDADVADTQDATDVQDATEAAVTTYPVTVVDQAGREVTITEEPVRLVSGYYISSSLLIALELDDKMVGVEAKADKRPIYKLSAPALMELPNVGSAKNFDLEGCIALEPDLVILPIKLKDVAATLEELNIPVLLVNPESQEQLIQMADIIAIATNTKDREQKLIDHISATEQKLQQAVGGEVAPSVYLAGNSDLLSTAGAGMYQSSMITLAGGANVAAEIEDTYWAEVDYERILAWNPEFIIIAAEADYSVEDVLADENLAVCDAVVNGNVYKLPSDAEAWDSPVPSGILGSVWLAKILHPDCVSDADAIIEEFYETFYDFKYNEK